MPLLLHLSDTHFGTCSPELVDALTRLSNAQRPDVLVISGDLTQRAREPQFAAARAFVDELCVPHFLCVPGNHDVPLFNLAARLVNPYGGYIKHFGSDLEPEIDTPDFLILGVNTTRRHRHKHGEVSRSQAERVARRLGSAGPGQLRVVVTHQPARVPPGHHPRHGLRGGIQASQAWADAGADLLLGGHSHLPYMLDVPAIGAAPRSMRCLQAGTALSSRVRHGEPNSVNLIRWSLPFAGAPRSGAIERWDFDSASGQFALTRATSLALAT